MKPPIHRGPVLIITSLLLVPSGTRALSQEEAPPQASTETSINPALLLEKLLTFVAENGIEYELSAETASALGVTTKERAWPYKRIISSEEQYVRCTPVHLIGVGADPKAEAEIFVKRNGTSHFVRIDRNAQVLRAIEIDETDGKPALIPNADAPSEVTSEFQYWGINAERAFQWHVCNAPTSGAHPWMLIRKSSSAPG